MSQFRTPVLSYLLKEFSTILAWIGSSHAKVVRHGMLRSQVIWRLASGG